MIQYHKKNKLKRDPYPSGKGTRLSSDVSIFVKDDSKKSYAYS